MQISAYTSIKSFKGSPYWMAPEVKDTVVFWCIFSLVSWNQLTRLFPRLSWIPMDIAFQLTFGALAAPFLRWQLQGLLGVSTKGCVCFDDFTRLWWLFSDDCLLSYRNRCHRLLQYSKLETAKTYLISQIIFLLKQKAFWNSACSVNLLRVQLLLN